MTPIQELIAVLREEAQAIKTLHAQVAIYDSLTPEEERYSDSNSAYMLQAQARNALMRHDRVMAAYGKYKAAKALLG
jgi:PDZ domain-containing secreted protein